MRSTQSIARQRLDEKVRNVPQGLLVKPPHGWITAVRDALGMSVRDLGVRMGASGQRVSRLEHDELGGNIRISSLERAAEAMNCQLVYGFVPRQPLDEMVRQQARTKAARIERVVAHNMRLEDQAVSDSIRSEQIDDLANDLIDRRGLWSDG